MNHENDDPGTASVFIFAMIFGLTILCMFLAMGMASGAG